METSYYDGQPVHNGSEDDDAPSAAPAAIPAEIPQPRQFSTQRVVKVAGKGDRQCTHEKRDGTRCLNAPTVGSTTCIAHGPSNPAVRAFTRNKIISTYLGPAFETLYKALGTECDLYVVGRGVTEHVACRVHGKDCPEWSVRVNAAKAIADRCGFGPKASISIEPPENDLSKRPLADIAKELEDLARLARMNVANRTPQNVIDVGSDSAESVDIHADS